MITQPSWNFIEEGDAPLPAPPWMWGYCSGCPAENFIVARLPVRFSQAGCSRHLSRRFSCNTLSAVVTTWEFWCCPWKVHLLSLQDFLPAGLAVNPLFWPRNVSYTWGKPGRWHLCSWSWLALFGGWRRCWTGSWSRPEPPCHWEKLLMNGHVRAVGCQRWLPY